MIYVVSKPSPINTNTNIYISHPTPYLHITIHSSLPPLPHTNIPTLLADIHPRPPFPTLPHPQLRPQRPPKNLQQHLKANPRNGRIIAPFAQLVADERICCERTKTINKSSIKCNTTRTIQLTLRMRHLVPGKANALLMQCLPYQIPPRWRDVVVFLAENLHTPVSDIQPT